ncbi:DUF1272 domain-containing protein [Thiothrix fructosivorans]|uniref:DUF1272 domain-containing protein n=1 Tax=Thiothrix fructosivorans TaxID=111770 RepID=A0A8B0SIY0_9GAMM|nr:DUF1272 domain-containing protein [Thiothrix fructosivorans]MBO0612352.1 DUF1272 domain-containing protein [Thiothrix fructosivorans]QTX12163.1 DUF1272 domain-containing protein [Thiothrix fructosivorans]
MLELRPSCENCNKPLPPHATDAMICSFECTFCSDCVSLLGNTCPNCGGGFVPRPIRPVTNWKGDNYLGHDPASTTVKFRPVDWEAHQHLLLRLQGIPPEQR